MVSKARLFATLGFAAGLLVGPGCAGDELDAPDHHADGEDDGVATSSQPLSATDTIADAVTGTCSTGEFKALSDQLVEEIQCLKPGTMTRIDKTPGIVLNAPVSAYLQTPAANALFAARKARGVDLHVISGLRTLPQQYVLYQWYLAKRCGIPLAAPPGESNHQSGLAIDIESNAAWRTTMQSKGFVWLGSSDPAHFTFSGAGTVDLRTLSVLAFQRLWNRNNANDLLAEDGIYGPATEARIAKSPLGGFKIGALCNAPKAPPTGDAAAPNDAGSDATSATPEAPGTPGQDSEEEASEAMGPSRAPAATEGCAVASAPAGAGKTIGPAALALVCAVLRARRRRDA